MSLSCAAPVYDGSFEPSEAVLKARGNHERCLQLYIAVLRELETWAEQVASMETKPERDAVALVLVRVPKAFSDVFGKHDGTNKSKKELLILMELA